MCGIAGISSAIVKDPSYWKKWAQEFLQDLEHRGPDDQGLVFLLRNKEPLPVNVAQKEYPDSLQYMPRTALDESIQPSITGFLVHKRLSIIAPGVRGHQPMCDATGRYWLTYNGEIFNYIELRKQYRLNTITDTDTEVLLELWAKMEEKCLPLLDGFFAFCIYDSKENTYTVVRDRTGVKPVYIRKSDNGFAFASEEKPLRKLAAVNSLNPQAVYLHMKHSMTDAVSWFDEVESLKAGHWVKWIPNLRSLIVRKWFDPVGSNRLQERKDLRELLFDSMRKRLRSDVPVGFAVSGGIDSAIILGLGRWLLGMDAKLHLFSVGAPGLPGDESAWQQKVHQKHGGSWHRIDAAQFSTEDFRDLVSKTARPAVAWNNVGHFVLCRTVRNHDITVLFNGQGADELFGGYPDYFVQAYIQDKNSISDFKDHWPLPASKIRAMALKRKLRNWMSETVKKRIDQSIWGSAFSEDIIRNNPIELHPTVRDLTELMMGDYYGNSLDPKFYGRLQQMLAWEDRNGMAFQLESRNPFADDASLPGSLYGKFGLRELSEGGYPKGMLRNAFKDLLPLDLYARTDKKGFTLPEDWLTQREMPRWESFVLSSKLDSYIQRSYREKLWNQRDKVSALDRNRLFKLASLGMFLEDLS